MMCGSAGYSGFPAYSQLHLSNHFDKGQFVRARHRTPYLRTVIVHGSSPYRYGAWTISSSVGFNDGALRMASEDSQLLNAAMISSSLRRRLPPRFIGDLKAR